MRLIVQLLTYNGAKYLPYLFESLKKQTLADWSLVILDNASTDNTVARCKELIGDFPVEVELIEGKENLGFAGGHNKLWKGESGEGKVEYVLLLNQDMYLEPDCLRAMVDFLDKNDEAGAVSPRLMRWNFSKLQETSDKQIPNSKFQIQSSLTDEIDTLGLRVFKNRRVVEKYVGKEWSQIKSKVQLSFRNTDKAKEVFGVSGALPMYRSRALAEVGLFDELYYLYKEDVDLAYRLRIAGWRSFVLTDIVAYHDRTAYGIEQTRDLPAIKNKQKQSALVKYLSYKNHLLTIYKNEYWQNLALDFFWILWYELKKFCYFLLFDRQVLSSLGEIWKNRKTIRAERKKVKTLRKVGWKEIRKWFG